MRLLSFDGPGFREWRASANRHSEPPHGVALTVSGIIAQVRSRGDAALLELTAKFDKVRPERLVSAPAAPRPPREIERALRSAHRNILQFARARLPKAWSMRNAEGAQTGEIYRPFDRVGIYVPAGSVPLVSTALMTVTLARAAGCREILVATPPPLDPVMQFAIQLAGATEILHAGGAQAVAAMALGTASVRRVQKICGPGNRFVNEAKRQVFGVVAIDQLAGPSEVMVIADATAGPALAAADLLAQAEHGPDSAAILLTPSLKIREAVRREILSQLQDLPRRRIIQQALDACACLVRVRGIADAVAIANEFAPEHLSLQVANPRALLPKIRNAGAIFLGPFSPVAAGDFVAGPSHTLPTGGAAKSFSGLTVDQFFRRTSVIEYTPAALRRAAPVIGAFARIEQLDAHGRSAGIRFGAPS